MALGRKSKEESFTLGELSDPVEILVDQWGVPHIYAASIYDAFRAQGFNAARDRLFQIDLWRRRGLGRLAEVFGEEYVETDRAARLFLYRGDMHAEWLAYGSDTKRIVTAFVEGINAYVRLTRENAEMLPVEFRELGYTPDFWEPRDVPRIRSHGLFYNLREEVARALTLRDYGADVENLRAWREPHCDIAVPVGLNVDLIPDDVLRVYDLATSPPEFLTSSSERSKGRFPEGSNNWVVSGHRTATGRPILANDPHRALGSLPGLRYLAHLCAPGLDVIGGGEPSLPGISIGHNDEIAFGLTIFAIDQEDLYVYETNPENPLEYLYRGRWEPMEVEDAEIEVRDCPAAQVEMAFTRHGPVIYTDEARHCAFAVRAAWLEPGMAPYLGSIEYMRAENCDEFSVAMNRWGAPPENQVFADRRGNIAWKAGGLTPIRPNWDGTLPVPGDGRYEWAGFYDVDELPGDLNPQCGWLATANEMNLPEDFPKERTISHDWSPPYRRERIEEVLEASVGVTPQDMARLQSDFVSIPAKRLLHRIRELGAFDVTPPEHVRCLLGWDCNLRPDSREALVFELWYRRHFRPAVLTRALEQLVDAHKVAGALERIAPKDETSVDARIVLKMLENPEKYLGSEAHKFLRETVAYTLEAALAEITELLGEDSASWKWGSMHFARPEHPLRSRLSKLPQSWLALDPRPRGGSGDCVGSTTYGADFIQCAGSSLRVVVDVGDWDSSLAMNSPGQSGRLGDHHFDDLFESWSNGESFPLLYTREAIEGATEHRIVLMPKS